MNSFLEALQAQAPAPDRASDTRGGGLQLYAFLVGSWRYDATYHPPGAPVRQTRGEIHAGWVLEGRAIQDVWRVPAHDLPRSTPPEFGDYFGTTLRVYDPALDAWHILWSDPLTQTYYRQLGRARGKDIVQEGRDEVSGAQLRWSFSEIDRDSFRWTGEASPDGKAWTLLADFRAKRV